MKRGVRTALTGRLVALVIVAVLGVILVAPGAVRAEEPIGGVKRLAGTVHLIRDGTQTQARLGERIHLHDEVRTGADGSVGITLDDETLISLGPDSALVIDSMVYAPAAGEAALSLRLLKGTLSYVSGGIARLGPENVILSTPSATIGIRGTHLALRAPRR
jgi:hypothetical protein